MGNVRISHSEAREEEKKTPFIVELLVLLLEAILDYLSGNEVVVEEQECLCERLVYKYLYPKLMTDLS